MLLRQKELLRVKDNKKTLVKRTEIKEQDSGKQTAFKFLKTVDGKEERNGNGIPWMKSARKLNIRIKFMATTTYLNSKKIRLR